VTDRHGVIATRRGEARGGSLGNVTVVDLGALWAAPLCADLLARCGARLVTVESVHRPDGSRRRPPFFEALHGRSLSVALDLRSDEGKHQLRELLSCADVVIEASRPRALAQLGIDAEDLVVSAGPRVWMSITAHGRDQPTRVGFGDDAAAAGGLVAEVDGEPRFVADAVADPLTGLVAAATIAQLVESGGRWTVDAALARVAHAMSGDWIATPDHLTIAPPVRRTDPGGPMPLGRDNLECVNFLRP
jgi:crotonobetainyl-CoA:carnitine CoA-transferase CaiB-like acyl-CoA transferase